MQQIELLVGTHLVTINNIQHGVSQSIITWNSIPESINGIWGHRAIICIMEGLCFLSISLYWYINS